LSVYSRDLNESTILWRIKSRKTFSHKQMSEHAKIKNTENLHEKPEAKKVTEERECTMGRKNYSDSRMCCDYKCSRVTPFLSPFLLEKSDIYIFGR